MTPLFRKFLGMNWIMVLTIAGLAVFGIFCVYSASWMRDQDGLSTVWKSQLKYFGAGAVIFFIVSLTDYKWMKYITIPIFLGGIGLLVLADVSGLEVRGQKGWLDLGFVTFQPSQVAIAGGILMIALTMSQLHRLHAIFRNHFLRLIAVGLVGGIPFLLVLKSGDFGSALVWLPVIAAMMLVGNIPLRYIVVIGLIGTMFIPIAFFFGLKDYQKARITVPIDMMMGRNVDTQGDAYSLHNNLMAIGSGGWEGKGFKSVDTLNYKGFISPHTAINDFIFPVLAEEHGFRGGLLMLSAFLLLLLQCLFVAFYSRDMFGRLIVVGVVALFFSHIYQNVGMNLLLMPITGIPLPLISSGGTFLIVVLFLLGLVESVWVHRNFVEKKKLQKDTKVASGMDIEGLD